MITGLNQNTAEHIQLGAGAILKTKYTAGTTLSKDNILTATNGGITFNAVPTWFTPSVDGADEDIADLKHIVKWRVSLTFTAVETSTDVLLKALGVAELKENVIKGKTKITLEDFKDLYVIGEKGNGDVLQITIKNAMSVGGLNLSTANNGNGGITFTINGHYKLENLNEAPFDIETLATTATTGA